ncbi:hypothetical protein MPER_13064, partial [Moniliophthora perniciosa FA553]
MLRLLLGFAALTLHFASGSPPLRKRAYGVTNDPSVANGQTFDFIVVGGGLAGTTVAARLAETGTYSVLLVEAGADDRWDPRVYDIYNFGQAFGTSLDWQFQTEHGNMVSGKTLGGSSSINGGHYTRGLAAQYDTWSSLLEPSEANVGWNWNSMFNYMKKSEGFSGPNGQQSAKGAQSNDAYHGFNGPVQVTYPDAMYGGPQQQAFIDTITSLTGITRCPDLNGGSPKLRVHDTIYIRTTWVTLTEHQVTKITWSNPGSIPLRAEGVQFAPAWGGTTRYIAYARKEVILAAGAIMLSGIGDSNLLGPLGIPTFIDLKTVGKNLQEQSMSAMGAGGNGFDPQGRGPSDCIAYPNIRQLFGSNAQSSINKINGNLANWANSQAG